MGSTAFLTWKTINLNSRAVAEQSNPTSKEQWLRGHRRAKRSYSTFKVRRGGGEEIPLPKVSSRSCTLLEQP